MPLFAVNVYVLELCELAQQFLITFAIDGVNCGSALGHMPVLGTIMVTLHAETLAGHDCEFFDLGSWHFM
jgi:hypothetical protein